MMFYCGLSCAVKVIAIAFVIGLFAGILAVRAIEAPAGGPASAVTTVSGA
jgi:hypothetical protein